MRNPLLFIVLATAAFVQIPTVLAAFPSPQAHKAILAEDWDRAVKILEEIPEDKRTLAETFWLAWAIEEGSEGSVADVGGVLAKKKLACIDKVRSIDPAFLPFGYSTLSSLRWNQKFNVFEQFDTAGNELNHYSLNGRSLCFETLHVGQYAKAYVKGIGLNEFLDANAIYLGWNRKRSRWFSGHPVIQKSWLDALEFCERLGYVTPDRASAASRFAFNLKRWPDVLRSSKQAIALGPQPFETYQFASLAATQLGQLEDAERYGMLAVRACPDQSRQSVLHFQRGEAHFAQGRYALASQAFQKALSASPSGYGIRRRLGMAALAGSQYRLALWAFNESYKYDKDQPEDLYWIGRTLHHLGQDKNAERLINKAIDLNREEESDSKTPKKTPDDWLHFLARAEWKLGKKKQALERLKQVSKRDPGNLMYARWLYHCHLKQADLSSALGVCEGLARSSAYEEAVAGVEAIITQWPRPRIRDFLSGRVPHISVAAMITGFVHGEEGNVHSSVYQFEQAPAIKGATAVRQAGLPLAEIGRYADAERSLADYIKYDGPRVSTRIRDRAYLHLAAVRLLRGDTEGTRDAVKKMEKPIAVGPYNIDAVHFCASRLEGKVKANEINPLAAVGLLLEYRGRSPQGYVVRAVLPGGLAHEADAQVRPGDHLVQLSAYQPAETPSGLTLPKNTEEASKLSDRNALFLAHIGGKYYDKFLQIKAPQDLKEHSVFRDLGMVSKKSYRGRTDLPRRSHWVYLYPNMYAFRRRHLSGEPRLLDTYGRLLALQSSPIPAGVVSLRVRRGEQEFDVPIDFSRVYESPAVREETPGATDALVELQQKKLPTRVGLGSIEAGPLQADMEFPAPRGPFEIVLPQQTADVKWPDGLEEEIEKVRRQLADLTADPTLTLEPVETPTRVKSKVADYRKRLKDLETQFAQQDQLDVTATQGRLEDLVPLKRGLLAAIKAGRKEKESEKEFASRMDLVQQQLDNREAEIRAELRRRRDDRKSTLFALSGRIEESKQLVRLLDIAKPDEAARHEAEIATNLFDRVWLKRRLAYLNNLTSERSGKTTTRQVTSLIPSRVFMKNNGKTGGLFGHEFRLAAVQEAEKVPLLSELRTIGLKLPLDVTIPSEVWARAEVEELKRKVALVRAWSKTAEEDVLLSEKIILDRYRWEIEDALHAKQQYKLFPFPQIQNEIEQKVTRKAEQLTKTRELRVGEESSRRADILSMIEQGLPSESNKLPSR